MKKFFGLFSVVLIFNVFIANAQQDYIITFKNDTIYGEILENSIGGPRFIAAGNLKKERIRIKEVKEYFIYPSEKYMVAQNLPGLNDQVFIERIERGRINLYQFNQVLYSYGSTGSSSNRQLYWYVSKDGGLIKTIKHNSWLTFSKDKRKNEFYELIKDNEEVASRFLEKDNFTFEEIRRLISMYNHR